MLGKNLAVNKQAAQKIDMERFNFRKVNELQVRKQYQNKISQRFVALENLSSNEEISTSLKNITENIKTTAKENLSLYE
jgi:hypothetical protein